MIPQTSTVPTLSSVHYSSLSWISVQAVRRIYDRKPEKLELIVFFGDTHTYLGFTEFVLFLLD